jgi:hypothetical protein
MGEADVYFGLSNLNGAVKTFPLLQTLEKYFPECYTRFLGAGSLLEL